MKHMNWVGWIVAVFLATMGPQTVAGVSIAVIAGNGSVSVTENQIVNSERQIQVRVTGAGTVTVRIRATSGTEQVRYIRVTPAESGLVSVNLHVDQTAGTFSFVREISRQDDGTSLADLILQNFVISGTLGGSGTQPSGLVSVNSLFFVDCGGDINADVLLSPMQLLTGGHNVNDLRCDGSLRGDISVPEGRINRIQVGGDIGSSSQPVSIVASDLIKYIKGASIWANIDAGVDGNGIGTTAVFGVQCTSGDLNGRIRANKLNSDSNTADDRFDIAGDLNADFEIAQSILVPVVIDGDLNGTVVAGTEMRDDTGTGSKNGRIVIGGDLNGLVSIGTHAIDTDGSGTGDFATIRVAGTLHGSVLIGGDLDGQVVVENSGGGASGALSGQIVINGNNDSSAWLENVVLGGTSPIVTLGPLQANDEEAPYYGVLSSAIGGGAIGLVPFMFHADESVPAHNSVVTTGGFTGDVTIEHYGPVVLDPEESGPPMQVYELSLLVPWGNPPPNPPSTAICEGNWTDVTSNYSCSISGRVVTVNGTFSNWKAYQFIPVQLDCNISDTPKVLYAEGWQGTFKQTGGVCTGMVATRGYGFQLKSGLGLFDLNDDEAIDEADIDAWLASPVDFNGDGNACLIDLALLIGAVAESLVE